MVRIHFPRSAGLQREADRYALARSRTRVLVASVAMTTPSKLVACRTFRKNVQLVCAFPGRPARTSDCARKHHRLTEAARQARRKNGRPDRRGTCLKKSLRFMGDQAGGRHTRQWKFREISTAGIAACSQGLIGSLRVLGDAGRLEIGVERSGEDSAGTGVGVR
jgi:hypothetical protein